MVGTLLELLGLALISLCLYLAWPPALLALVGLLLVVAIEVRSRR